jgi:hypothetical protein
LIEKGYTLKPKRDSIASEPRSPDTEFISTTFPGKIVSVSLVAAPSGAPIGVRDRQAGSSKFSTLTNTIGWFFKDYKGKMNILSLNDQYYENHPCGVPEKRGYVAMHSSS